MPNMEEESTASSSSRPPAEEDLDYLEEWDPSRVGFERHLAAGSLAGLAEHCFMFPLDTIKTNAQCVGACGERRADVLCMRAAKQLLADKYTGASGMRLWRGISAVTVACIPAHAIYFSSFEATRHYGLAWQQQTPLSQAAKGRDVGESVFVNGLAGAVAAVGHDCIMTPADVVKQRLQLGHHRGLRDAFSSVLKSGGVASLYRSLPTTLAMNVPNGCLSVAANEWFKAKWRARNGNDEPLGIGALLASGGVAGAAASFVTTPLDVVKTRLQTQGLTLYSTSSPPSPAFSSSMPQHRNFTSLATERVQYHGFFDAASSIWRQDGPRGFVRGASIRAVAQAPSVAIVWTVYELLINASLPGSTPTR